LSPIPEPSSIPSPDPKDDVVVAPVDDVVEEEPMIVVCAPEEVVVVVVVTEVNLGASSKLFINVR